MEQQLLDMLVKAVPGLASVLMILGAVIVIISVIIKLTPSTADDEALEHIKAIPLVGGIMAALVGKSPIQEKQE